MNNDDLERLELPEPAAYMLITGCGTGFKEGPDAPYSAIPWTKLFSAYQVNAIILADRQRRAQVIKDSLIAEEPVRYLCNKCGYVGDSVEHDGCKYLARAINDSAPPTEPVAWLDESSVTDGVGIYFTHAEKLKRQQYLTSKRTVKDVTPVYTRPAQVEVTEAMVRRAVQATVDYIFNKAPAHEDVITARDNAMRAALVAALGGGDGK